MELEIKYEEQNHEFIEFRQKMKDKLEASKNEADSLEAHLHKAKKEASDIMKKYESVQKKFVELETLNDKLTDQLRQSDYSLNEVQSRLEQALEHITLLQFDAETAADNHSMEKLTLHEKIREIQEDIGLRKVQSKHNHQYM